MSLTEPVTTALVKAGIDPAEAERVVRTALAEDLRYGPDVTHAGHRRAGPGRHPRTSSPASPASSLACPSRSPSSTRRPCPPTA